VLWLPVREEVSCQDHSRGPEGEPRVELAPHTHPHPLQHQLHPPLSLRFTRSISFTQRGCFTGGVWWVGGVADDHAPRQHHILRHTTQRHTPSHTTHRHTEREMEHR
jgi:hypothetical protein